MSLLPQYIMIVIVIIALAAAMNSHGKTFIKDFRIDFISILIGQALLIWGGFYDEILFKMNGVN